MINATHANRVHALNRACDEKKEKFLRMVEASDEPLGLPDISKALGLSWWSTFRLVVDPILEEVQRHPEWTCWLRRDTHSPSYRENSGRDTWEMRMKEGDN